MSKMLDEIAQKNNFCRLINKRKSKNFPTAKYGTISGKLLGYAESDEHYRKRILENIRKY